HYLNLTQGVSEGQITRSECEAQAANELKKLLPEISDRRLEYRAEELIKEYKNGQLETDGMAAKEQAQELSQVVLNGIANTRLFMLVHVVEIPSFRAGIDFLYEQFYFLADVVEERIENGDLSEYVRLDEEETDVNEYIARKQVELYLDEEEVLTPGNNGLKNCCGMGFNYQSAFEESMRYTPHCLLSSGAMEAIRATHWFLQNKH
ncbi:38303_t:CDS:2, partial [Gigaspora margarita]